MRLTARLQKVEGKVAQVIAVQRAKHEEQVARVTALILEAQGLREKEATTLTAADQEVLRRADRVLELMTIVAERKAAGWSGA